METKVIVRLQVEGFHRWDNCNVESEMYLRNNHRHLFYICCKKLVTQLDREVEVISFKNQVISYLKSTYGERCEFGSMSCEMIATKLLTDLNLCYCSVIEDNENGAEVEI